MISSIPKIPYPDIYQYTENVTDEKPTLDIGSKALEVILIPIFFIQGVIESIIIIFDIAINSLIYNAKKISKKVHKPIPANSSILKNIRLSLKNIFERIKLSAKNYVLEHWVFQKNKAPIIEEAQIKTHLESHKLSLSFETLQNKDKQIDAMIIINANNQESKWIIYCPGVRDSYQASYKHLANTAAYLNCHLICCNALGVGKSRSHCLDLADFYIPAQTALRHLNKKGFDNKKITIWGHSLGGAQASEIGRTKNIRTILDRTFTSFSKAVSHFAYAPFPCNVLLTSIVSWALPVKIENLSKDRKKTLIISAKDDNVIDFQKASADNLKGNACRLYCTFQEKNTPYTEKLTLSHSAAHTPTVLDQLDTFLSGNNK